jgi:hypothetical protein
MVAARNHRFLIASDVALRSPAPWPAACGGPYSGDGWSLGLFRLDAESRSLQFHYPDASIHSLGPFSFHRPYSGRHRFEALAGFYASGALWCDADRRDRLCGDLRGCGVEGPGAAGFRVSAGSLGVMGAPDSRCPRSTCSLDQAVRRACAPVPFVERQPEASELFETNVESAVRKLNCRHANTRSPLNRLPETCVIAQSKMFD